ncbi:MAG: glutamine-hydrolyzing carbamoyl-phosphate synthase small subunit [Candidatus Omnitrophica bacterium]|nr:glutamine-hydrolyzing carbamoyl-phosphate synthase small subunit [Candidatus Omnitrophota bacterium]
MKGVVVFEDGTIFKGQVFGAVENETFGEIVFNTSISGYQEILTDPSYKGQIVTMTYPLIGNYGVNSEDVESNKPQVSGFIIKELSDIPSNFRSESSLDEYLRENDIIGIQDVDTRALTRHIRIRGAMKGMITTETRDIKALIEKVKNSPGLVGRDLVKEVTCKEKTEWNIDGEINLAVLDCGVKYNILRHFEKRGCKITRFPADTGARAILDSDPDGIFLSNGPGDPEGAPYVFETVRELLGKKPIFGICLGQQMLGLALGGKTYKLKFGHRGGNQPVKDVITGRVSITAQNHGFCVDLDSLKDKDIEITHINLNDNTVEGIKSDKLDFFSVQYHPEAAPGPNDAAYLFDEFVDKIKRKKGSPIS